MKIKILFLLFAVWLFGIVACEPSTESKTNELSEAERETYLNKGKEITGATFSVLGRNLRTALDKGGVVNAVQYCNLAAMPLVDSLSQIYQVSIRRVSSKVRNPKDKPKLREKLVLDQYEKQAATNKPLEPKVHQVNDTSIAFYAPIQTIDFCLQCHGRVGETLKESDYAIIRELYPKDEAIGYQAGDFRGMWSLRFTKPNN